MDKQQAISEEDKKVKKEKGAKEGAGVATKSHGCLLYTSDAADE